MEHRQSDHSKQGENQPAPADKLNEPSSGGKRKEGEEIIYFPKMKKLKTSVKVSDFRTSWIIGKGLLKRSRPILIAAAVSTIFASLAFSVMDPSFSGYTEPVLRDQQENQPDTLPAQQAAAKVTIPAMSMWIVQAGVYKEASSAEAIVNQLKAEMPVVQIKQEDKVAIWVGATGGEAEAKVIANQYASENLSLYVKEVSRPQIDLVLTPADTAWLQSLTAFISAGWSESNDLAVPEELVITAPENKSLQPISTKLTELNDAAEDAGRNQAFLELIRSVWELTPIES
ncbi:hypothetical protein [Jeotgalibacillus soli]|uniref:SPOR domain-containing protein n=1 Tax=Jeotgalibacillus soli TaxID=889306 RepID=A0A0C2R2T5_9BACL|nr:hypothetical protein [Jeotgalibacillus soli]KIL44560.1 hypothetical protein KP78_35240 [Jeotgalibacillus soli]